jgi:hypothetical protein
VTPWDDQASKLGVDDVYDVEDAYNWQVFQDAPREQAGMHGPCATGSNAAPSPVPYHLTAYITFNEKRIKKGEPDLLQAVVTVSTLWGLTWCL